MWIDKELEIQRWKDKCSRSDTDRQNERNEANNIISALEERIKTLEGTTRKERVWRIETESKLEGVVATRFAHSSSGKDEVFDQYHHMKNDTRGSFDEACVPEGDWNEHYSKKQKKYNLHLALGVATFVLTCTAVSTHDSL
ncbi:hypothetical protein QAD02_004380 [Eretmocerus hayati]|uniref:Uncharacterized protein n=1 Tax=Eretmocerus hayati TaxID=131215 RepID=A0ACC2NPL8_9HYME|nr:hypothetical protein QAD02_004380 [Eretmocerus hayati]